MVYGADVNAAAVSVQDEEDDNGTALYLALMRDPEVFVRLLPATGSGADVQAKGEEYGTPLHAASATGCEAIVRLLVENGADIHSQTEF